MAITKHAIKSIQDGKMKVKLLLNIKVCYFFMNELIFGCNCCCHRVDKYTVVLIQWLYKIMCFNFFYGLNFFLAILDMFQLNTKIPIIQLWKNIN